MNVRLRQILASIILGAFVIISTILLAPFLLFFFAFILIFSLIIRMKIIKNNPDFFKNYRFNKKGRVIDQEEDINNQQPKNKNLNIND
ncbi:hypothetical protein [Francisella frigiditurris]|uniref:Uncharacterized protein n=1 Tax=Francisella frigiditurris TaxID=1542390 RepID=A0A1J0KTD7_9GAMM|nr:hypothetical protein [Francisella frigiditurris]APC96910.1 hypothetical protein KX01_1620 [Francisella frigiditurris]